jgi:hypothetical protein
MKGDGWLSRDMGWLSRETGGYAGIRVAKERFGGS